MQKWAETFYKGTTWQACRNSFAEYKNGLCEECLKRNKITPGEIVHHKKHLTADNINNPNITLNWDNLQLLCRECHAEAHKDRPELRYYFDDEGHCIIKEESQ